jgi:regulator of RNase E activity RraA
MSSGFKVKGVSAIVIDGGVRDVPLIRKMELPVFAKYATPAHIADTLVSAELNASIECDGVQVNAGDIIIGDDDGVVVIPKEVAPEAIERGWRHEKLDLESRKRILAGTPLGDAYPPREEWLKEK